MKSNYSRFITIFLYVFYCRCQWSQIIHDSLKYFYTYFIVGVVEVKSGNESTNFNSVSIYVLQYKTRIFHQFKTCIFYKEDLINLSATELWKANANRATTSPISALCFTFTHFSCRNKIKLNHVPLISDELRFGDGVRKSKEDCHVKVNLLIYVTGLYKCRRRRRRRASVVTNFCFFL
jgi:hypothetical protein